MGAIVHKRKRNENKVRKESKKTYNELQSTTLKDTIFMEFNTNYPNGTLKDMQNVVKKYRPNATDTANYLYGWKILNDPDVKQRISKRNKKRLMSTQLSYEEKLVYLTGVVLGYIEPDAETKDRLKALDIANKMEGQYVNTNVNINKNMTLDEERALAKKRIDQILGLEPIETEVKEVSSETIEESERVLSNEQYTE